MCRRAALDIELASTEDQRVLRWFGYMKRMDVYRMAKRVLLADVSGGQVRSRPRLGWIDGVNVAMISSGMAMEAARQCGKDKKEWSALALMSMIKMYRLGGELNSVVC